MTDVKVAAEPSAAQEPVHYDGWDEHGTPIVTKKPDPPKSEEPAASAASAKPTHSEPDDDKSKGKSAAEPEAAPSQEKKERKPGEKKSADERIAELIAENKRLKEERERPRSEKAPEPAPKTESEAKPSSKDAPAATYVEWRKAFKPKEWIEKWAKDNPSGGYEDAVAALGDYQADMRASYQELEAAQQRGRDNAAAMLSKTVEKYPDAEAKVKQTAKSLMQPEVPQFVRALIDESEVMTDLLYTLSDQATLEKFLETAKTAPGKAIRVLRDMELEIQKAIAKPAADKSEKSEKPEPPAEPKPRAPKPPSEVGGRGTGHEDAAVAAARAGDYTAFEAAENAKMQARFKRA